VEFDPDLLMRSGGGQRARSLTSSKSLWCVAIFLFSWGLTTFVYHHTYSNFLRAESGWYLFLSHSTPVVQENFVKVLLAKSYKGHYAPLAFLSEFVTAKVVGTHAGFWKWRQISVLALVATAQFLLLRLSAAAFQLSSFKAGFSAGAITAVLIFQPLMREFISWPFMIFQLLWMLLSVMALISLVQMARFPSESIWPWLAAAASYASLHCIGLGIATVAATAAAMAGIKWTLRLSKPSEAAKVVVPLLSMAVLATIHAAIMVKSVWPGDTVARPGWEPLSFVTSALGFTANFAIATLRGLFSTGQATPEAWQTIHDWPYGLAILLGFGCLLCLAFFRCLREPRTRNQVRLVLHLFTSVSFLTMVALISFRVWREPSPNGFGDYLFGSRYLIPGSFALAGSMAELLCLVAFTPVFPSALLSLGLGACAILGNFQFAANIRPKLQPTAMISHEQAWRSIVTMARECQDAGLAIPNIPLGELTQEFHDWDLKLFEPLLRADLKTPPETTLQIEPWPGFANASPEDYSRKVPSLAEVRKQLKL
jgi:hypothetical protein